MRRRRTALEIAPPWRQTKREIGKIRNAEKCFMSPFITGMMITGLVKTAVLFACVLKSETQRRT
jgi:hypothetical protein